MGKILIVNNDFDMTALLQTWLQYKNYIATFTGNAEEVPQLVIKFKPDMLIVDVLQGTVVEKTEIE